MTKPNSKINPAGPAPKRRWSLVNKKKERSRFSVELKTTFNLYTALNPENRRSL